MFRPMTSIVSCSVLVLAGFVSTTASATEVCDLYTTSCTRDCYVYVSPVINAECDLTNAVIVGEATIFDPPPAPLLKCTRDSNSYSCTAWPQGDELSYSWSNDSNSVVTQPASSPQHSFSCGTQTASVAIMTPAGATSVASATLPACN
jgi:hypothetical protein